MICHSVVWIIHISHILVVRKFKSQINVYFYVTCSWYDIPILLGLWLDFRMLEIYTPYSKFIALVIGKSNSDSMINFSKTFETIDKYESKSPKKMNQVIAGITIGYKK